MLSHNKDASEENPNEMWGMIDWISAVGDATYIQITLEAIDFGNQWSVQRIGGWVKEGIPGRDNALVMIAILRKLSKKNKKKIFSNDLLRIHTYIFMRSKACREKYAEPDDNEIEAIFKVIPNNKIDDNFAELRGLVHPSPPLKKSTLFGRESDLKRVLEALQDKPLVVIDGLAGEGKTTLAWFTAIEALQNQLCLNMDWITDKRSIVMSDGKIKNLRNKSLDTIGILQSLVRRFQWNDLIGEQNYSKLENGCAKYLREGRYLIVIDNLETREDSDEIVRLFLDMLAPKAALAPLTSRVLVTSREKVENRQCKHIDILGIESQARIPYLRFLEEIPVLSDHQCQILADVTEGNPLFMQIALQSYELNPHGERFIEIVENLRRGIRSHFHEAFQNLFGTLLDSMVEEEIWIARYAAMLSLEKPIRSNDLQRAWMLDCQEYNDEILCSLKYENSLRLLIKHRILNPIYQTGIYTMHALIRTFFLES